MQNDSVEQASETQKMDQWVDAEVSGWRGLRIYAIYRMLLASTFLGLYYYGSSSLFLGGHAPGAYQITAQAYLIFAVIVFGLTLVKKLPFYLFLTLQLIVDTIIITEILHFSGGIESGLGALLILVVVIGSLFSTGKKAFFYAAIATLALFVEMGYTFLEGRPLDFYRVGLLGLVFFATALLAQILGSRAQKSEGLMHEHASEALKTSELNQYIVDRLKVGVVTVDKQGNIYSLNQAARYMLGIPEKREIISERLSTVSPPLFSQLSNWRPSNEKNNLYEFKSKGNGAQIMPTIKRLSNGDKLIFLDDLSVLTEHAQQMKLASLGRMAASIAHEVRNPLGAISQATELLAETGDIKTENKNLLQIIDRHCSRVNGVIDAVLQLSQNKILNQESFLLDTWLETFVDEFCQNEGIQRHAIVLTLSASNVRIRFDPAQLRQILWNLCSNAYAYADKSLENNKSQVLVRLRQVQDNIEGEKFQVDVLDNGPGVSATILPQLFEPFSTERKGGVGLGLHLAREMAHTNGADLSYIEGSEQTCFRLTISPDIEQALI